MRYFNILVRIFIIGFIFYGLPLSALAAKEKVIFASNAKVEAGEKLDTVIILGGNLEFRGECDELILLGGSAKLFKNSRINKNLILLGGKLEQEPGAHLTSEQIIFEAPKDFPKFWAKILPYAGLVFTGVNWIFIAFTWLLAQWLLGVALQSITPKYWQNAQHRLLQTKGRSLFGAVLAIIAFVPGLLALVISLVGILFIPLFLFFYFFAYLAGGALSAEWIGKKIPALSAKPQLALLAGLVLFLVVKLMPMGGVFVFALHFIGAGAIARATWRVFFPQAS